MSKGVVLEATPELPLPGFPGGATVLMAVYGRDDPALFQRAVDSVVANSVRPDDFVLVLDGPVPDPLGDRIADFQRRRVLRAIALERNQGLARALNRGLAEVRTEWVLRADADDLNLPDRFEAQARAIQDAGGELDLVGGAITEVDRDGTPIAVRDVPTSETAIIRRVRWRNPFNHMTVAFRTSLARQAGGYPEIFLKEDYAFWATLLALGARCRNLDRVLVHATTGREMYQRRGGLRHAASEWSLQLHLHALGHKTLPSAVATGLFRAGGSCLPSRMRGWLYQRALRSRVVERR